MARTTHVSNKFQWAQYVRTIQVSLYYCIYPKYGNTLTLTILVLKFQQVNFTTFLLYLTGQMDYCIWNNLMSMSKNCLLTSEQCRFWSAASDLGLHYLLTSFCPNTLGPLRYWKLRILSHLTYGNSESQGSLSIRARLIKVFTLLTQNILTFYLLKRTRHLRRTATLSREVNVKTILPLIRKGVYSKRKEFAPFGSKFFPFRVDPFLEGSW